MSSMRDYFTLAENKARSYLKSTIIIDVFSQDADYSCFSAHVHPAVNTGSQWSSIVGVTSPAAVVAAAAAAGSDGSSCWVSTWRLIGEGRRCYSVYNFVLWKTVRSTIANDRRMSGAVVSTCHGIRLTRVTKELDADRTADDTQ